MKTIKIIGIVVVAIILVNLVSGCSKDNNDLGPKAGIYKTSGDYFNNVNTWGKNHASTSLNSADGRIRIENGIPIYCGRIKLVDGYILAMEHTQKDYFTDITIAELVEYNDNHSDPFPQDSIFKRVIDKDPYTEFYGAKEYGFEITRVAEDDKLIVEELNEIIRNGEIETYFDKIK